MVPDLPESRPPVPEDDFLAGPVPLGSVQDAPRGHPTCQRVLPFTGDDLLSGRVALGKCPGHSPMVPDLQKFVLQYEW